MKKILMMAAALLLGSSGAWALGTTAGTEIENNATLTYSAGGIVQPEVNTTQPDVFLVDKKVDMILVTTDSDQVEVTPGQKDRITHFKFENEGNADQNFTFSVSNLTSGEDADFNSHHDNDNVNDLLIQCSYTKRNSSGVSTVIQTWASTFTLEIAENGTAECNVSADINDPDNTPQTNDLGKGDDGDIMNIELLAVAVDKNLNPEVNSSSDTQNSIDVVLADGVTDKTHTTSTLGKKQSDDNSSKGDVAGDGKETARSGYVIKTPVLSVKKTSCVLSDPVTGADPTKAVRIPGAIIRYMFDINNTGTGDVNDLNLTDTFNAALDTGNTKASATKAENLDNPCICASTPNATTSTSQNIDPDTTVSGQKMTITKIDVNADLTDKENHTCVWVEVEIR